MANISDANGTVTLVGTWMPNMCQKLNILKEAWASWRYNIDIYESFTPEKTSQHFCGNGRWAFHANLEFLDSWTRSEGDAKPEFAEAYAVLTSDMERFGSQITFDYADEEGGCQFICTGAYDFAAKDGHFIIASSSEEPHDYGWEAYLNLDFGGEDLFDELVEGLLRLLVLDETGRDEIRERVEAWATTNTTPHDSVDCMEQDKVDVFRAAFPSARNSAATNNTFERSLSHGA